MNVIHYVKTGVMDRVNCTFLKNVSVCSEGMGEKKLL